MHLAARCAHLVGLAAAFACVGFTGSAEPFSGKEARGLLFAADKADVTMFPVAALSAQDAALIAQIAATQKYYGAVAISPEEGIASAATVAAVSYNDVTVASAAALADCNAKRKAGTKDCVLVAEIRPKGWKAQPLSLGADATAAFAKDYGRRGPRAMAVSDATGKFAIAKGEGAGIAATAACATASGAADCRVVIAD